MRDTSLGLTQVKVDILVRIFFKFLIKEARKTGSS